MANMPMLATLSFQGLGIRKESSHVMNNPVRCSRFLTLAAAVLGTATAAVSAQTVTLTIINQSSQPVTVSPQLTVLTPPANGTATLTSGSTPITVAASGSNSQVSVLVNATSGAVSTTLEVDGSYAGIPFTFIQVFGSQGPGQGIVSYNLSTVRPFNTPSVLASSGSNYTITLTIPSNPLVLSKTNWSVKGTVVQKDGKNFFAKAFCYSPTPIGGATFEPGVGDWFCPPWWTYNGVNSPNDIGQRDIANLTSMGGNAVRTYFTWYWMKQPDLNYLQGITQNSPLPVYTDTQYPYTVFFDHLPFLDACYKAGIQVVLGIAIEGGNCFNHAVPSVSSAYQNFYLQTAQKLASLYGNHPAVMGFCMGNEQNNASINTDSRTYVYYQSMYKAIKAAAPNKLVTIAFQDDPTLYNGTLTVTDQAGQNPPTPFNGMPIEKAISTVVDVWGLNIYGGISTDFPNYQKYVVNAASGKYARPLWITEWGTPSGKNNPAIAGPISGNAQAQELSPAELATGAQKIAADISYMHTNLGFVAGAFYFEYSDEWWKNASLDPTQVNTAVSPLNPQTGMFQTNGNGQVTMLNGSLAYPAYPFTHDGSESPDWPEECWGLFGVAASNGRAPQNPDPNNPDTLDPRQPYITAVTNGYATLAAAYASESPSQLGDVLTSNSVSRKYGHETTAWGIGFPVASTQGRQMGLFGSESKDLWVIDPFGLVKILADRREGITARLLDWGGEKVFLPRKQPNRVYFFSTDEWRFIQEDANLTAPGGLPVFLLTPPRDSDFSDRTGPFEEPAIPSAPIPQNP